MGARVDTRSGGELEPRLACLAARRRLRLQPQVREDLPDHRTLHDRRDDLHLPAAAPRAALHVDVGSIPGVAELQARAAKGDKLAHQLVQMIALDNLRHLLSGTSARIKADGVTGLYGGFVESGLSISVTFEDRDRPAVLAALVRFADNFNQEQVHVRRQTKDKPGTR